MSDPKVIAAVITGGCVVLGAVVAVVGKLIMSLLGRLLDRIESVKHEVSPNEGKSSHDQIMASLSTLTKDVGGLRSEQRADRAANAAEHGQLRATDRDLRRRIDDLHPPGGGTGTTNP